MVCCTYFNDQKDFGVDVLDFQFLAWIFWLQFGLHFQILGEFLFNFLVTIPKNQWNRMFFSGVIDYRGRR